MRAGMDGPLCCRAWWEKLESSKRLMSAGTTNIWFHNLVHGLSIIWIHEVEHALISKFRALGNKSGSFCEAVNCERSEQEGKFLFAALWLQKSIAICVN